MCFDIHARENDMHEDPVCGGEIANLPRPAVSVLDGISIGDALRTRCTTRDFSDKPLSMALLSDLLHATFGEFHGPHPFKRPDMRVWSRRRSSPSGAGIHSHDAYVVSLNIETLERGVYRYRSHEHELVKVTAGANSLDVLRFVPNEVFVERAGALVIVVTRFDALWRRYPHSRAYRTALLDVGHLSQTFHLVAAALGLGSWLSATYDEDVVSTDLGLNEQNEGPMLLLGVGHGEGYLPREFLSALQESVERQAFFS
jgi:SagB-type dehydrogenase family enzyme